MIRRVPVIPTVIVIIAIAILVSLGAWQLRRAGEKEHLLARYAAAADMPPIGWPTAPIKGELPLFRHATAVCLRPVGKRATGGESRTGEPGYVQIVDCATGAEGPGLSVQVGWSKDPNVRVQWPGGPVSGIIVPDKRSRMRLVALSSPVGLEPSAIPSVETASPVTPGGHRMYAATWFALALAALIIYIIAVMKRGRKA